MNANEYLTTTCIFNLNNIKSLQLITLIHVLCQLITTMTSLNKPKLINQSRRCLILPLLQMSSQQKHNETGNSFKSRLAGKINVKTVSITSWKRTSVHKFPLLVLLTYYSGDLIDSIQHHAYFGGLLENADEEVICKKTGKQCGK